MNFCLLLSFSINHLMLSIMDMLWFNIMMLVGIMFVIIIIFCGKGSLISK